MILALLKKNPALSQDIKDAFKPDRQMKFKTKTILRTMQKQEKKHIECKYNYEVFTLLWTVGTES